MHFNLSLCLLVSEILDQFGRTQGAVIDCVDIVRPAVGYVEGAQLSLVAVRVDLSLALVEGLESTSLTDVQPADLLEALLLRMKIVSDAISTRERSGSDLLVLLE
jgi:hypothetical protein